MAAGMSFQLFAQERKYTAIVFGMGMVASYILGGMFFMKFQFRKFWKNIKQLKIKMKMLHKQYKESIPVACDDQERFFA